MILYGYQKCSTCKKALSFLKERDLNFTFREITKEPPSIEELKKMLKYKRGDLKKIFNTSGELYRKMQLSLKLKTLDLEEALKLLNQQGMLVKRPFLLGDNFGIVGFNEADWIAKIKK